MKTQAYKCPHCKKFTRHIEVSYLEREYYLQENYPLYNENKLAASIFSRINDVIGLRKVAKLIGTVPYKCCECGACHEWNAKGEWSW